MLRKTMPDNNKEHKDTKEHYRHIMLYYFRKGKSATQTCKKIHKVYGSDAVTSSTCRKWFQKFKDGNYEVKDAYRAGRPVITDVNKLRELVEDDRGLSAREIGKELNIAGATVSRHVKMLGLTRRKPDKKDRERARELHAQAQAQQVQVQVPIQVPMQISVQNSVQVPVQVPVSAI